ncbi:hypothetical protein ACQEV4_01695 [Streptomyces shenzhenensis]|uniref:hypothetical protein n=1 Tax=Streptomyces shenzhenensis TaxID=943815 RepID=UPI003D90A04B
MTEQPQTTQALAATEAPAEQPPVDHPPTVPAPPKDRRVLRAVLRWTATLTVFAALGAGTAYGITRTERTDVPGLATESDGRWPYPEISAAPLPAGSPGPLDPENRAGRHYADLRALLLPAPEGAEDDKALRGTDGWLAKKEFLKVFLSREDRDEAGQLLTDYGLRHTDVRVSGVTRFAYDEVKPYGAAHVRQAYLGGRWRCRASCWAEPGGLRGRCQGGLT